MQEQLSEERLSIGRDKGKKEKEKYKEKKKRKRKNNKKIKIIKKIKNRNKSGKKISYERMIFSFLYFSNFPTC